MGAGIGIVKKKTQKNTSLFPYTFTSSVPNACCQGDSVDDDLLSTLLAIVPFPRHATINIQHPC